MDRACGPLRGRGPFDTETFASFMPLWRSAGMRLLDRYQQLVLKDFDRILKGTPKHLEILRNKCRDHELFFKFVIVQPAISAKKVSKEQLAVLGTSYSYIKSISGSDIKVIVSP